MPARHLRSPELSRQALEGGEEAAGEREGGQGARLRTANASLRDLLRSTAPVRSPLL